MGMSLDTARLHLRLLEEADESLYCHLYTDAGTMRHIGEAMSQGAAKRNFRALRDAVCGTAPSWALWVMVERESGCSVGLLGLLQRGSEIEIGSMLLEGWRGLGFSTEVVDAVIRWGFEQEAVESLMARHAGNNRAGERVMQKLGFSRVLDDAGDMSWRLQLGPRCRAVTGPPAGFAMKGEGG